MYNIYKSIFDTVIISVYGICIAITDNCTTVTVPPLFKVLFNLSLDALVREFKLALTYRALAVYCLRLHDVAFDIFGFETSF